MLISHTLHKHTRHILLVSNPTETLPVFASVKDWKFGWSSVVRYMTGTHARGVCYINKKYLNILVLYSISIPFELWSIYMLVQYLFRISFIKGPINTFRQTSRGTQTCLRRGRHSDALIGPTCVTWRLTWDFHVPARFAKVVCCNCSSTCTLLVFIKNNHGLGKHLLCIMRSWDLKVYWYI